MPWDDAPGCPGTAVPSLQPWGTLSLPPCPMHTPARDRQHFTVLRAAAKGTEKHRLEHEEEQGRAPATAPRGGEHHQNP